RVLPLGRLAVLTAVLLLLPACGESRPQREWKERGTLRAAEGSVQAVAVSPDGRRAATAETDGMVRLWDWAASAEVASVKGHSAPAWAVAFSPDGRTLASCGRDRTVRLWDAETLGPKACFAEHGGGLLALAFSPDGASLAVGSADGTVTLWDVTRGRPRAVLV